VCSFLREVAGHSAVNAMDSSNLAIVFAPTLFQSDSMDPLKAAMEIKFAKIVLKELIDRRSILQHAMHIFGDRRRQSGALEQPFIFENQIDASVVSILGEEFVSKMNIDEVRSITDNFSNRLNFRLNHSPRGGSALNTNSSMGMVRGRMFSVDEYDYTNLRSSLSLEDAADVMQKRPEYSPVTFSKDPGIVSPTSSSDGGGSASGSSAPTPVRKAAERMRRLSKPSPPPKSNSRDEDDDDGFATPPPGDTTPPPPCVRAPEVGSAAPPAPAVTFGSDLYNRASLPLPALPTQAGVKATSSVSEHRNSGNPR
jgi:hypothetical protein